MIEWLEVGILLHDMFGSCGFDLVLIMWTHCALVCGSLGDVVGSRSLAGCQVRGRLEVCVLLDDMFGSCSALRVLASPPDTIRPVLLPWEAARKKQSQHAGRVDLLRNTQTEHVSAKLTS